MTESPDRTTRTSELVQLALVPIAIYTLLFVALTWPAAAHFTTHFFTDDGDGPQNVWNLWWVNRAVAQLHQSPWHTAMLHYPYGTTLIGHTLNPFNGFLAMPFLRVLPLVVVHNGIVTFAFVASGVTAFLLARHLTRAYWPSVIAGAIFTFSSFHVAHAQGHLQLVSTEWIPLFLLLWLRTLEHPTSGRATASAVVLWLVLLCDFYYFFYCAIAAGVMFAVAAARREPASSGRLWRSAAVFGGVSMATSGVLVARLIWSNATDPFTGSHVPAEFSLDVLSPFIYGAHWRFADWTRPFWARLRANPHESSVHLGFSVMALCAYAWLRRAALDARAIKLLAGLFALFLLLALGPTLQIGGREIVHQRWLLPYGWLQALLPILSVSGVPVRMMVMVTLSAAILCAFSFAALWQGSRRERIAAGVLAALLVVEYLPKPIPLTAISPPAYVRLLKEEPGADGVLDLVSTPSETLAFQTIHEKPLAFGYISRVPQSVARQDASLERLVHDGRYERLWPDYGLRYVVIRGEPARALAARPGVRRLGAGDEVSVFDISKAVPP